MIRERTTRNPVKRPATFADDDARWQAIVERDPSADGAFFYSVKTTGVYCRPVCAAKLPLRKNVRFHATTEAAQGAGFRPCKRCKPSEAPLDRKRTELVARACRMIDEADAPPTLDELAGAVGMSVYHFHRIFKAVTGVTPKGYANARRAERMKNELHHRGTVTEAIYRSGFNSGGRFYETSTAVLGMTPKRFRNGGDGAVIRFTTSECRLGSILVAMSDQGVCAILLGDDPEQLTRDVQAQFPGATAARGDRKFESLVAKVIRFVDAPANRFELPLDIRGTAFQQRVWQALTKIPPGSTASYAEIARRIGRPKAIRAVAQACAANTIAVAIPCHRAIRIDGSPAGYRWGVKRKVQLLRRERQEV